MEYAGHHNIYTAYGAIILLCPLSSKRKKQKQMNFKLHINMNLSPDFSWSTVQLAERTYFANKKQAFAMGGDGEVEGAKTAAEMVCVYCCG